MQDQRFADITRLQQLKNQYYWDNREETVMLKREEHEASIRAIKRKYCMNENLDWEQDLQVKNLLTSFRTRQLDSEQLVRGVHDTIKLTMTVEQCRGMGLE